MARTRRKSIKAAAAIIAIGLAIGSLLVQSANKSDNATHQSLLHHEGQHLRRLSILEAENTPIAVSDDATFDPNSYAYLIIHYHKTGHHLARDLRDFLVAGASNSPKSNNLEKAFKDRMHEEETGCPHAMELRPGIVHVQAAPNLFCDTDILAEYLLRNDDASREKRGVKVIHLVRNPFSLAVSNWIYHAQYPTPESWVKNTNPCAEELWFEHQSFRELVRPTLMLGEDPIMYYNDFDELHRVCMELYQTNATTVKWTYHTHLRHLEARKALELATSHMMIQGISGGDILRMANNLIKLRQIQNLEGQIRMSQHLPMPKQHERMIQVMTLSMEEFTTEPRAATLRFLDFALEDASPLEVKERIATEYENAYLEKVKKGDEHITFDKELLNGEGQNMNLMKPSLEGFLRRKELFGRILGNIEKLVNDCLSYGGNVVI